MNHTEHPGSDPGECDTPSEFDRALIIEVGIGPRRFSYQLGTDRVWQVDVGEGEDQQGAEGMVEYLECPEELRACLRMAAVQRFLDLPVDEALLDWQVRGLWSANYPGQQVQAWNLHAEEFPRIDDDGVANVLAAVSARYPAHPAAAHLDTAHLDTAHLDTAHLDAALLVSGSGAGSKGRTGEIPGGPSGDPSQLQWSGPQWCDVESVPPRTLALDLPPRVRVHLDHVEFACDAFGPPGHRPLRETLMATLWDPQAQLPLVTAVLSYNAESHQFRGTAPRFEADPRISGWSADSAEVVLDIAAYEQPEPLPRDADHELGGLRWRSFNQARHRLVDRFRADGSGADQLTLAEKVWAMSQPPIVAGFTSDEEWLLDIVDLDIPGRGRVGIDPADPSGDWILPDCDRDALRRLGIVEFYPHAWGGSLPADTDRAHAWGIDKGLARAAAGDLTTAGNCISEHGGWLVDYGRMLADRTAGPYLVGVIADSCRRAAQVADQDLATELNGTAAGLTVPADLEAELDRILQESQIPVRRDGRAAVTDPKKLARKLWLARRIGIAQVLVYGDPAPTTQLRVATLSADLRIGCSAQHSSELAALCGYPAEGSVADRPLLVELVDAWAE